MPFGYNKTKSKVRPVRHKKEKVVKPNINELKRVYRVLSREAEWTSLDTISVALHWWDTTLLWLNGKVEKLSSKQAENIAKALRHRRQGFGAATSKEKLVNYIATIRYMEKAVHGYLKTPRIEDVLKKASVTKAKMDKLKHKMAPKFSKLVDLLHAMFSSCPLEIEVVPYIRDISSGEMIARKFEHTLNKMYYSRAHAKELAVLVRREGLLAVAIQECFYLSRAMSFTDSKDGSFKIDHKQWVKNQNLLLANFLNWSRKAETPKRLVKKAETKKVKIKKVSPHEVSEKVISIEEGTNIKTEA